MRELKFRAWDTGAKCYVKDPVLVDNFGNVYVVCEEASDKRGTCLITGKPNAILEQYTGLKDKNGKEVYEGDIVKRFKPHEFLKGVVETEVFRIRWGVKKAGFFAYNKTRKRHSQPAKRLNANDVYEIIGNIHENPELIGEENDD